MSAHPHTTSRLTLTHGDQAADRPSLLRRLTARLTTTIRFIRCHWHDHGSTIDRAFRDPH